MLGGKPFFTPRVLGIICRDLLRSGQFYRDVLGASALPADGVIGRYQLGSLVIELVPIAEEGTPATYGQYPMVVLAVEVDDLAEAREHFARCGVAILRMIGDVMLVIADPDGLAVEVTERPLPPGRFRMVRIPVPGWAPSYARDGVKFDLVADECGDAITPAERDALVGRHEDILALVDERVEEHANGGCCPPGPGGDWFPRQVKLTGEFYIGGESYHRLLGASWIQVCVKVRCLGRRPSGPHDYLGLHVWVRYDPESGRLWSHRNTDSMVI